MDAVGLDTQITMLADRLAAVEEENRSLRTKLANLCDSQRSVSDPDPLPSRRGFFRTTLKASFFASTGLAGAAVLTSRTPQSVEAASDVNYVASGAPGVSIGFDAGTRNHAVFDVGVKGNGFSSGVVGVSYNSTKHGQGGFFQGYRGVVGLTNNTPLSQTVPFGYSEIPQVGVYGAGGSYVGVWGQSSTTTGVWGASDSGNGVIGFSRTGLGVYGTSGDGAGGVFAGATPQGLNPNDSFHGVGVICMGTTANIRLQASSQETHPDNGTMGDLFVDSSGSLWYCQGGASWKQLA